MSSVADIWNQALGLIGADSEIQDPDTETSAPARACRRYWVTLRDEVIRDFPWPKLSQTQDLTLVEEEPNDGIEWLFTYAYPANCAKLSRLLNGATRIDTESNFTPYRIGRKASDGTTLIYTDIEDAQVEFTYLETEVGNWDADMVSAAAHLLASRIAAHFGPDAVKLGDRALKMYVWRMNEARANALNEQRPDIPDSSSFQRARG